MKRRKEATMEDTTVSKERLQMEKHMDKRNYRWRREPTNEKSDNRWKVSDE